MYCQQFKQKFIYVKDKQRFYVRYRFRNQLTDVPKTGFIRKVIIRKWF